MRKSAHCITAGIIVNEPYPAPIVHDYVSHDAIIAESNANLDNATAALTAATVTADYNKMIGNLIPSIFKVGKGAAPTITSWKRSISTLKARNLLVNKRVAAMTSAGLECYSYSYCCWPYFIRQCFHCKIK